MVKIVVIFSIVFMYYCEINAEIHNLQNKETATEEFQKPLETEDDHADIERLQRRARVHSKETQTNRNTKGSQEDNNGLSEFIQSDSESLINNYFKPGVVNSRRLNKINTVKENTKKDKLDSESIKSKKRKKYRHHSRKNVTKKHNLTNNEGKEIHKKDEKDISENDGNSGTTSRTEKLHTQKRRFKIKDRDDKKKSKHPKDTSMSHEREKDKKKQVKEKSKHKKEEKKMDKTKEVIKNLSKATTTTSSKNDKINKTKQLKGKRRHKQNEPSKKDKIEVPLRRTKPSTAQSKATVKVTKPPQQKKSKKNPTTTKSTQAKPKPTKKMLKEIKGVQLQKPILRAHRLHREPGKHPRPTKLSALSLHKRKPRLRSIQKLRPRYDMMEKEKNTKDAEGATEGGSSEARGGLQDSYSNLSPYAITTQMNLVMKEFPDANVSVTKSARSVEYNDIVTVTVREGLSETERAYFRSHDSKYIDDVPEKKIIFIVHGLTVMGLKHMTSLVEVAKLKILMSYYLKHLDKFDFIIMPLANPDGYSASLASDRILWNKNVSPQDVCSGVFLDRNFDVAWNSSHDISSCSQLYPGATAFSEEESKAVRDVLHRYSHKILAYIHVHAGTFDDKVFKGDAVLYPKGYTLMQSDDDKYIDMKGEIDEAMKNSTFRVMSVTVDTLANWYGIVQGTSVDYAASVYGIPYALEFVMQIYDSDDAINGALTEIWSRLIDATFNSMWNSLQRGADARRKHFRLRYLNKKVNYT